MNMEGLDSLLDTCDVRVPVKYSLLPILGGDNSVETSRECLEIKELNSELSRSLDDVLNRIFDDLDLDEFQDSDGSEDLTSYYIGS